MSPTAEPTMERTVYLVIGVMAGVVVVSVIVIIYLCWDRMASNCTRKKTDGANNAQNPFGTNPEHNPVIRPAFQEAQGVSAPTKIPDDDVVYAVVRESRMLSNTFSTLPKRSDNPWNEMQCSKPSRDVNAKKRRSRSVDFTPGSFVEGPTLPRRGYKEDISASMTSHLEMLTRNTNRRSVFRHGASQQINNRLSQSMGKLDMMKSAKQANTHRKLCRVSSTFDVLYDNPQYRQFFDDNPNEADEDTKPELGAICRDVTGQSPRQEGNGSEGNYSTLDMDTYVGQSDISDEPSLPSSKSSPDYDLASSTEAYGLKCDVQEANRDSRRIESDQDLYTNPIVAKTPSGSIYLNRSDIETAL